MAISMWPVPGASAVPTPQVSSPPAGGFGEVSRLLTSVNLGSFEVPLKGLGVETVTDLKYVTEADLREMKMTVIQGRKFAEIIGGIITGGVVSAPLAIADATGEVARQRSRSRQRGAVGGGGGTVQSPGKSPSWQDKSESDGSKPAWKEKSKQSWIDKGWKEGGWKDESGASKGTWKDGGWKDNGWKDMGENGGKPAWNNAWKDDKPKWGSWKDDKSGKDDKSWKKTKSSWKDDATQPEPKSKSSWKDTATQPEPTLNESQTPTPMPEVPKPLPESQPKQQAPWSPLTTATSQGAACNPFAKGGGLLVAKAGSAKAAVHVVQTPGRSPVGGALGELCMLPSLPPPIPPVPPVAASNAPAPASNVLAALGNDSIFKVAETLLKQNGQRKFYWEEVAQLKMTFNLSERTELALKLLDPTKLNALLRESGDLNKLLGEARDKDDVVRSLIKIHDSYVDQLVTQLELKEVEINGPR